MNVAQKKPAPGNAPGTAPTTRRTGKKDSPTNAPTTWRTEKKYTPRPAPTTRHTGENYAPMPAPIAQRTGRKYKPTNAPTVRRTEKKDAPRPEEKSRFEPPAGLPPPPAGASCRDHPPPRMPQAGRYTARTRRPRAAAGWGRPGRLTGAVADRRCPVDRTPAPPHRNSWDVFGTCKPAFTRNLLPASALIVFNQ